MPNTCTICRHERREEIEDALARGESLRNIASQFNVGYQAVNRHQDCITTALQASQVSRSVQLNETLLQRLARYRGIAEQFLNDEDKALSALDRCYKQLDLEAKLTGRYQKKQENEPDTALRRAILIEALLLLHAQKSEEQAIEEVKLVLIIAK